MDPLSGTQCQRPAHRNCTDAPDSVCVPLKSGGGGLCASDVNPRKGSRIARIGKEPASRERTDGPTIMRLEAAVKGNGQQ